MVCEWLGDNLEIAPENVPVTVLVTGASGRVGRAFRAIWGQKAGESLPILWQSRNLGPAGDLIWDIGQNPPPVLPDGLIVLHLAGKTSGPVGDNVAVTKAVCVAARMAKARHVFVMSTAAVYAPGPLPLDEAAVPAPQTPYGESKRAAEQVALRVIPDNLTILRLANLAGADALLGTARPHVSLDPVNGQPGGPERSYIGPRALAGVLADLLRLAARGTALPHLLNLAQQPPVAMADLLTARGQPWSFGPPRAAAVPRVVLNTDRLASLTDLPQTSPSALIADLNSVPGWP